MYEFQFAKKLQLTRYSGCKFAALRKPVIEKSCGKIGGDVAPRISARLMNCLFRHLVKTKRPVFHGVALSSQPEWITELENCIRDYQGIDSITLISQTCTKFESLVKLAMARGLVANIYVQEPAESLPRSAQDSIRGLPERIGRMVLHRTDYPATGGADIYYYTYPPTYRAVAIGNDVLGIQLYVAHPGTIGGITAGELRLIVRKHFSRYSDLRRELVDEFRGSRGVSRTPVMCGNLP